MNIPDKAIQSVVALALKDFYEADIDFDHEDIDGLRERIRNTLEAAAPYIAAGAIREVAEEFGDDTWESVWAAAKVDDDVSAVQATTAWMRTVADDMEANQ